MQYLADKRHNMETDPWMELVKENFRPEDGFVIDSIETSGPELLSTKECQSEFCFSVTGRNVIGAAYKWAMLGPPKDHGQYLGYIPTGLFKEEVLDHRAVDVDGERYQTKDRVLYRLPLKECVACSWIVYKQELARNSESVTCVRVPDSHAELQAQANYLILGMGFETNEGYLGVITRFKEGV